MENLDIPKETKKKILFQRPASVYLSASVFRATKPNHGRTFSFSVTPCLLIEISEDQFIKFPPLKHKKTQLESILPGSLC